MVHLLRENLITQLEEVESLKCIFYKQDELVLESDLNQIREYISEESNAAVPLPVRFKMNLNVCERNIRILITLPHKYPNIEPYIKIDADQLTPADYSKLVSDVKAFVSSGIGPDNPCIFQLILWLQEYFPDNVPQNEVLKRASPHKEVEIKTAEHTFYSLCTNKPVIRFRIMADQLRENLSMQLEEVESLQCIFYKQDELILESDLDKIRQYISKGSDTPLPPPLRFKMNLNICDKNLSILITLPHEYPNIEPNIQINADKLKPPDYSKLVDDVKEFVYDKIGPERPCIFQLMCWLQEYFPLNVPQNEVVNSDSADKKTEVKTEQFSRLWIYSHHIYDKEKRKRMLHLAKMYHISGFCLPGKPGIICIEGRLQECTRWWCEIKAMTWKRIYVIKTEDAIGNADIAQYRKFHEFEEIDLSSSTKSDGKMDMGKFYNYLVSHQCGYIFKDYFGVEGKLS